MISEDFSIETLITLFNKSQKGVKQMWEPTILVVDDELGPRESFRQILKHDYNVVTKENGKSALEYIETQTAPEVMLLDIKMPDLSGIEVLKKVKEILPKIEVVMITAYAKLATAREALKYGASEYLIKPSNVKEVREAIKNAVSRRIQRMQYNEKFAALLEISQSTTSSLEIEDVCEEVVDWCEKFFLGKMSWIALYKPETEKMEVMASKGIEKQDEGLHSGIAEINEEVFKQGQKVLIKQAQKDKRFVDSNTLPEINANSILVLPLEVSDRVIGVLGLCSSRFDEGETDATTMNLLTIFANQTATALENCLSRQRLQKNLEKLKDTQEQLIQAEKFRALGEMTSGAAHNFNNFLTGILGYASLLLRSDVTDQESFISKIKQIEELAQDAANLVERLQASTKGESEAEFRAIDLRKLVEETVDLATLRWKGRAEEKEIEVETELQKVYSVVGDENQLKEVMTNLVFNAVDAMPEGGKLTLKTFNEDNYAVVVVSDTGVGMTEEVKGQAFEPFFTTKGDSGTGLGLSTSKDIIQSHYGEIVLESEPGKGTTFKLRLPSAEDAEK